MKEINGQIPHILRSKPVTETAKKSEPKKTTKSESPQSTEAQMVETRRPLTPSALEKDSSEVPSDRVAAREVTGRQASTAKKLLGRDLGESLFDKISADSVSEGKSKPTREEIQATLDEVRDTGNLALLDSVDPFRQNLTPELQAEYDKQVAELREDDRIEFEYRDGAEPNPATEDLALRGIVTASFFNPEIKEQVIGDSLDEDGKLNFIVYPDNVPLGDFYEGNTGASGGLATESNDIAVGQRNVEGYLKSGNNVFVHEFAHLQQRVRQDGSHERDRLPGDFPYPEQFAEAYSDPKFQKFLMEKFGATKPEDGGDVRGGQESYPTAQELFLQYPDELKAASPELYQEFARYNGYDPLSKEQGPKVQLNGKGDPTQAFTAIENNFSQIAGEDGKITESDLQAILNNPNASAETQAAAALFLSSDVWKSYADVGAGKGKVDGVISLEDVQGGLASLPTGNDTQVKTEQDARAVVDSYLSLADTAAGKGKRDGNVSKKDLEALLADPGTPEQLRMAAELLLNQS